MTNRMEPRDVPVAISIKAAGAATRYAQAHGISVSLPLLGDCVDAALAAAIPEIEEDAFERVALMLEGHRRPGVAAAVRAMKRPKEPAAPVAAKQTATITMQKPLPNKETP
ncbi:MAG: hypothetical protein ACEQSH_00295 [Bacteroidia bacterium]